MNHNITPSEAKAWVLSRVERFSQSAFRITAASGLVIVIDIFEPLADSQGADIVLVTHEHPDHFEPGAVKPLLKPGTRVVTPASMKAAGTDQGLGTDTLAPGETKTIGTLTVTAVRAYNRQAPFHPYARDWVGYLFEVDGLRVYHAGDTDLIPEMEGLAVDVALIPVGGMFTMGWQEAVQCAELLKPAVAVPMHYGKVPLTGEAGRHFAEAWTGTSVLLERP